jgi:hypothetical protein
LPNSVQNTSEPRADDASPTSGPTTNQPAASGSTTEGTHQDLINTRSTKKSRNGLESHILPTGGSCTWSYDPDAYLIFGKLEKGKGIDAVDSDFILSVMENPNFTLVMEGLVDGIDKKLWSLKGL